MPVHPRKVTKFICMISEINENKSFLEFSTPNKSLKFDLFPGMNRVFSFFPSKTLKINK